MFKWEMILKLGPMEMCCQSEENLSNLPRAQYTLAHARAMYHTRMRTKKMNFLPLIRTKGSRTGLPSSLFMYVLTKLQNCLNPLYIAS